MAGMTDPACLRRRAAMRLGLGLAASAFGACVRQARADGGLPRDAAAPLTSRALGLSTPDLTNAAIMVAGPADAATGRWAGLLARPLAQALHPGAMLAVATVGGRDGVTGANAFEALINPDGSTALLVPGAAAIAWLAGDPRVHFDAGRWVPALTSLGSAVLLGRTGPQPATLRVAASTPSGLELPALLGLSLLGAAPVPVFGLSDPDDAHTALLNGRVDAIVLTGRDVPRRAAALSGQKLRPIFSFGADAGGAARDPMLADVPTLPELYLAAFGRRPAGALFEAWKATAAAARLDAALVLQPLTPASLVAQWRRACASAITDRTLASATREAQLSPLPAPDCVTALSAIIADENTLLALRRWIASRTDWRPA
jgi:hypothetical protein